MKKRVTVLATAAALSLGGVALANGSGPIGGVLGLHEGRQAEFVGDLASELEGVSAEEVRAALDAAREKNESERRTEIAAALAAELDGVGAEGIADALAKQHEALRQLFESGERPEPGTLHDALAQDLGVSEEELRDAFEAAHEAMAAERRAELERRLDQAVEGGELSEERADEIRERLEAAPRFGPGGPGGHLGQRGPGPGGFGPPAGGPGAF